MKRILAIEDNEPFLDILKKYLSAVGYDVSVAYNGKTGMEICRNNNRFDLVITDINMPGISGNDVARQIRKTEKKDVPIVAVTGANEQQIDESLFDSVLIKPFDLKTLEQTISRLL
jgi:CheY-like chemotaxis protein